MIFVIDSKEYLKAINNNIVSDEFLVDMDYILVTNKIKSRGTSKRIIGAQKLLYPDAEFFLSNNDDEQDGIYIRQLNKSKVFLARIIKHSIEDKTNIIFIASKRELKGYNYMEVLDKYIYDVFKYHTYPLLCDDDKIIDNKHIDKTLEICDKIIKKAKLKRLGMDIVSEKRKERKAAFKEIKKLKNKEIRKVFSHIPEKFKDRGYNEAKNDSIKTLLKKFQWLVDDEL